ncbi:MAG: hypothetical protein K2J25_04180, partial [Oscillospiraceae bacterium]|nr:hypothetical protein [Oscillospiraceae bacterium]
MKKIILFTLLASMILFCTACKKQQANLEIIPETTVTEFMQSGIISDIATNSGTESEFKFTTNNTTSSESNATNMINTLTTTSLSSETTASNIATTDPTESALQLEMQEALQNAIDEEERQAIQNVQETRETAIYYKDPTLDFNSDNFQNLNMQDINLPRIQTSNGYNVHKYFFEAKPMSGKNLLQMQKMAIDFADVAIDINHINSRAETLE